MARFLFASRPAAPRRADPAWMGGAAAEPRDPAELPRGPGWYDSSWELTRGLQVEEDQPEDCWLQAWLLASAPRPGRSAARRAGAPGRAPQTPAAPDPFEGFDIGELELL